MPTSKPRPRRRLSRNGEKPTTAKALIKALRESGLIGMWKDRTDIQDSVEFARQLRQDAEKRGRSS